MELSASRLHLVRSEQPALLTVLTPSAPPSMTGDLGQEFISNMEVHQYSTNDLTVKSPIQNVSRRKLPDLSEPFSDVPTGMQMKLLTRFSLNVIKIPSQSEDINVTINVSNLHNTMSVLDL